MLRYESKLDDPLAPGARAALPRLRLSYDLRSRSRVAALFDDGTAAAIVLPRGTCLRDGDVLVATTGELALVEAAPQPLSKITAASTPELLRALFHLANRHVAVQIAADHLLIERDPVLARMLLHLGASVVDVEAPFEPEAGAYQAHRHEHEHEPGHDHGHGIAHDGRPVSHGAGDVDPDDAARAGIGELLSIQAHRGRSGTAGR
jgi:urease accessory protein